MSAILTKGYVISSMGLFDVKGLASENPELGIGSPLFNKVTIQLNNKYYKGKTFTIETVNNNTENIYVNRIMLNGRKLAKPFIQFRDVVNGGKLILNMSARSNDNL